MTGQALTPIGWHAPAKHGEPSLRRIALLSLLTIVAGIGGLLLWASIARLDSAVPAAGVFISAGMRKTISLLDNGILRELDAREGDRVAAGQVLLRLDDSQARAALDQAAAAYWAAAASAARLQAEAMDQRTLAFPRELTDAAREPAVAAQIEAEHHLFDARNEAFDGADRIARRHIEEQQATVASLESQIHEMQLRIGLFESELKGTEVLLAKGLATKVHAMELERDVAELRGAQSDLAGREAETKQQIAQSELGIINAAQARRADITKDRTGAQAQIADAAARMRAARDTLDRQEVRAPEAGVVTDLHYVTPGSSIVAGQPVLDLVPLGDKLLVEAHVAITDIENVHVGQKVNVRLTAYKAHQVPAVTGHLTYVGADRQIDADNTPYFLVRAQLDPDALHGLHEVSLYPGMPADVLILGGERTALDYFIAPIRESIRHGMNER
jgi:HlyD family secretion protein